MAVITIANQKGGAGKTTIATALYFAFLRSDVSTLLIDADPQQSIIVLSKHLDTPLNVITKIDSKAIDQHTLTIIDTPPDYKKAKESIKIADIVLMPFKPSQFDVIATLETVSTLKQDYPNKAVFAVLNCNMHGTSYPSETIDILKEYRCDYFI